MKGGDKMNNNFFAFFLAILTGFALIMLPGYAANTPLAGVFTVLSPILVFIGLLVVVIFALVLVWRAFKLLFS
jgi:hypothetical protein